MFNSWSQQIKKPPCAVNLSPQCPFCCSQLKQLAGRRLTAAALSVLLQQLPFRTDAVVRARRAHTLVLAAVLHRVTQVHVCKHTGNASKGACKPAVEKNEMCSCRT